MCDELRAGSPWRWLADAPALNLHNHCAMFTHYDRENIARGMEGRPGGFGWANLESYLSHPDTLANTGQPITDEQSGALVAAAGRALGLPYDWAAILALAATSAGLPFVLDEWPEGGLPGQGECASVVDYFYEAQGLPNPGGYIKTRGTAPDDWAAFVLGKLWAA